MFTFIQNANEKIFTIASSAFAIYLIALIAYFYTKIKENLQK